MMKGILVFFISCTLWGCSSNSSKEDSQKCSKGVIYHLKDIQKNDTSKLAALFIGYSDITYGKVFNLKDNSSSFINRISNENVLCKEKYNHFKEGVIGSKNLFEKDTNSLNLTFRTIESIYYRNSNKQLLNKDSIKLALDVWNHTVLEVDSSVFQYYLDSLIEDKSFFVEYTFAIEGTHTIKGFQKQSPNSQLPKETKAPTPKRN